MRLVRISALAVSVSLTLVGTSGCGPADRGASADEAWSDVMKVDQLIQVPSSKEHLEQLRIKSEVSKLELREDGIRFWDRFPEDPRRFDWLVLSAHLAPDYEYLRTYNSLAHRSSASKKDWESRLDAFVAEFEASPRATERDKRLLELGQVIDPNHGTEVMQTRADEFYRRFSRPFSELDKDEYYATTQYLLSVVTDRIRTADGDQRAVQWLANIRKLGNPTLIGPSATMLQALRAENAGSTNKEAQDLSLPSYPSFPVFGDTSRKVFVFQLILAGQTLRELGYLRWRSLPRQARLNFLNRANWESAYYPTDMLKAVDSLSADFATPIEQDQRDIQIWQHRYGKMKAELFATGNLSDTEQKDFLVQELFGQRLFVIAQFRATGDKEVVNSFLNKIRDVYKLTDGQADLAVVLSYIFDQRASFGLGLQDIERLLKPMRGSKSINLKKFVESVFSFIEMTKHPIELTGTKMHGGEFRSSDHRGKLLLIDHWTTTCTSCIAAMPRIRDIAKQYSKRDFDVVSIAYDAKSNRARVLRIEKELGADWVLVDGEPLWESVAAKYGYQGVPQYMLLGRDGRLIAGTADVNLGKNLKKLVDANLRSKGAGARVL